MAIARRLKWYLDAHEVHYEVVSHPHTSTSLDTAHAARVPEDSVAKSVLLEDELGYVMAILPAGRRIALSDLQEQLHRRLELASESELENLFFDCEVGAVPPVGEAYGIPTVVDESLLDQGDVYFEAGDHEGLIHMEGAEFASLLRSSRQGHFAESA